jgi:hypothetical protein
MATSLDWKWSRIFAEGVAIVVSILLAFAIQAWWDDRSEDRLRKDTIEGLLDDFRANQLYATGLRSFQQRAESGNTLLVQALDGADPGTEVVVSDSLLVAAISAPLFPPARATLDEILATGRLGLIRNQNLREALTAWLQVLERVNGHEMAVRQIVTEQVVPLLARQTSLAEVHQKVSAWSDRSTDLDFISTDHVLRSDLELVGVLAHRAYRTGFIVSGQETLISLQARIITELEEELTR